MIKALQQVGEYVLLMRKALTPPTRWSMFFKQLVREIYKLGVDSIWIVVIISIFIGTVIAIHQLAAHPQVYDRLHHARDHPAGVLLVHHVSYSGR